VNPIVAVFLGWSFGGERMSLRMLAAAALVAGAVALVLTGSGGESAAEPARPSFDVRAEKPRPTRVAMPVTRGRFYPLGAPHGGAPPTCPVTCTALTNRGEPA
jgi:drug/metabolite transporter (DMT)-like permease